MDLVAVSQRKFRRSNCISDVEAQSKKAMPQLMNFCFSLREHSDLLKGEKHLYVVVDTCQDKNNFS